MSNPPEDTNTDVHSVTAPAEEQQQQEQQQELWYLKPITFKAEADWPSRDLKIITQNSNGPCSFIAICNILVLRGRIEILPPERTTVTYDYLSQLIGDYMLATCPDVDISAALSIMPNTRKGMDLNPLFTGIKSFRPAGDGGELKLFEQAGIELMHGWLVDPDSSEYRVLARTEDYDTTVNLLVEADHLAKGRLVTNEDHAGPSSAAGPTSPRDTLSPEERQKVDDAILIRNFIEGTQSQLTYHGLFALASVLAPGALAALFRSSHLAVLYKAPADGALYTLVTDQVFLHERSVVWERLEDIDGGSAAFVDAAFVRASPAGGDYAGHTGESALAALEGQAGAMTLEEQADQEFARRLQAEEDEHAQQVLAQRERDRTQRATRTTPPVEPPRKKKSCIIM